MEEDQGSDRDHPAPESVTPEEAVKRLFGQEKIKLVRREIKRGEFMVALDEQIEAGIKDILKAENDSNTARLGIFAAQAMQVRVKNLEANDFRVSYLSDQFGNLSIQWASREDIGFKRGEGK